jgi:hypothetical protein
MFGLLTGAWWVEVQGGAHLFGWAQQGLSGATSGNFDMSMFTISLCGT